MRAFVLGPPASGKTTIVKALCEHYKLHHIKIKDVVDEAIEALVSLSILFYLCWTLFLKWLFYLKMHRRRAYYPFPPHFSP